METNNTILEGSLADKMAEAMRLKIAQNQPPPIEGTPPATPPAATPPISETPVVETPAATPPVEGVVTPISDTPSSPSLLDVLSGKVENPTETPTGTPTPAIPAEVQAQLDAYNALQEAIASNPLYKAFAMGKDVNGLKDIIYSMIPEDNSKLPFKDLVELDIKSQFGVEGELLKQGVDEILARYEDATPFAKLQMEKEYRDRHKPTTPLKESDIIKAWEAEQANLKANQLPEPTQEDIHKIVSMDLQAIDTTLSNKYLNQEVYGFKIDENVAKAIKAEYNDVAIQPYLYESQDGKIGFNEGAFINDTLMKKYGMALVNAAYEHGKKEGVKGVANPDGKANGATPSTISTPLTGKEGFAEALRTGQITFG